MSALFLAAGGDETSLPGIDMLIQVKFKIKFKILRIF